MKILLINPPRRFELMGKNPSIIEKHRGFNPPLGLLYIVSTLKKFSSHQVDFLDAQPHQWTYAELEGYLRQRSYDVIGVSAMTFTLIDAYKTVEAIERCVPRAKVVIGGTHVHLFPDETIALRGVDYAFMGEAEFSFLEFLSQLANAGDMSNVSGLVYRGTQGKVSKNSFTPVKNLNDIPFPERNILDIRLYNSLLSRGSLSTTIISSRGCPFKCAFCDRPLSPVTSHFRPRDAKNVLDEVSECLELGIKDFLFYDDTFTVNRKRVLEICEEILARKLKFRWDIRTRVDTVDKEMLEALKRAGCAAIHYGVEAGNDRILKLIKKGFTVRKVREVFELTKKIGIETLAYFMIGLPSERTADIQDSFQLAKDLKPDYAHFTVFSPYPGTELYHLALEKGLFKTDIWREFSRNPVEGFRIPVWKEFFTREQLYAMIVKFYRSFYLRPRYLVSRVLRIKSRDELLKKARAGLSVLQMKKDGVDKLR